jgi:plastocyanin
LLRRVFLYLCSMRIHILPLLFGAIGAQTIFYQQDFNSGVPSDWSLNTSDLGSTTTLLYNRWIVGADYNGNDVDNPISSVPADPSYCCPTNCSGYCAFLGCAANGCISASIPPIPDQPAAITGAPQSAFLHVSYNPAYDNVCPPATTTFSYLAPTQYFPCYPAANLFAKMSQPVAIPASATNVKLSFFWLAGGGTNAYGEVYYSTNGTTWTQLTSRNGSQQLRNNANSWYADTISLPPSVAGQNLYIGFRFVNQVGSGHADPPLGVDEIRIFADVPVSGPTIDITSIPPVPTVCAGNSVSIAFSTTGSFGAGNQFTVQLSDATGSFTAPLATATGASSPISLTIPTTVATGSYKIRVISSNPAVVSDTVDVNVVNLSNLTCFANPSNPTAGQAVTFTLNGTGLPTGTFNISLDIDNNGTPDYTQNGVSLPYSFTHTYTATGTYTAVFTLTHPASGCRGSCQITVNVGAAPTLTLTSVQPSGVCAGGTISIQFSASGSFGAGNTFTAQLSDLSGSFANPTILGSGTSSPISAVIPVTLNSGTYQVRVVSSNPVVISNTQTLTITNIQSLRCNATPNPANAGQAVQIQLTGTGLPSGTLNVTFNPGDGSSPQSRSVSSLPVTFTHTYANPGNYNATFTVSEPVSQCVGSCSVPVQVQAPSSLSQAALMHIRLYPNPSRGGAFLEGVPVGWEVRVLTPLGQVLYRERSEGRTLHLPSLPQGFYLVEIGAVGSLRWVVLE